MACAGFPTVAWWTSGRIFARCGAARANRLFVRHVGDRHRIHLVPVLVDDRDEPSLPTSARHRLAMPEFFRQHHRLLTRRGVARQVHSLRVFQAFSPIRHMKIIPRHRVLTHSSSGDSPAVHALRRARKWPSSIATLTFTTTCADPADPLATGKLDTMRWNI